MWARQSTLRCYSYSVSVHLLAKTWNLAIENLSVDYFRPLPRYGFIMVVMTFCYASWGWNDIRCPVPHMPFSSWLTGTCWKVFPLCRTPEMLPATFRSQAFDMLCHFFDTYLCTRRTKWNSLQNNSFNQGFNKCYYALGTFYYYSNCLPTECVQSHVIVESAGVVEQFKVSDAPAPLFTGVVEPHYCWLMRNLWHSKRTFIAFKLYGEISFGITSQFTIN